MPLVVLVHTKKCRGILREEFLRSVSRSLWNYNIFDVTVSGSAGYENLFMLQVTLQEKKTNSKHYITLYPSKDRKVVLRKGKRNERKKGDIMNGETKMEFSSK